MNELDEHGGDGGTGSPNEPNSILAGGGFKNEEKPLVNDENKEEGKEEKQGSDGYDWLPEKFRVQTSDGLELDLKASAEKMAASYDGLSKRMGTGDIPPKSADEYDLKIESETLNFDDFKKDPENHAFLSKAHEQGMTSKQVEFVLNEYARVMPAAFDKFKGLTIEQAQAELTETWKSEADFKSNIKDAFTAFNKYASPEDKGKIDEIGNNPIVIRLLANMGKGLREDAPPAKNTGLEPDNVAKIMISDAYRDPRHPDYKEAQRKVREYYQSKHGSQQIS
ncbi:hypothetical protein DM558_00415 [Entomomonas moraniae]|uniref:Capsid assembly protein n=2 Tax=Entomomonas moraniae TaxID=2213226 RepID=A0A3Q9JLA1_9GAMM|nr:hypothetical protein DM558_00415 [Entomomonas moraniae]